MKDLKWAGLSWDEGPDCGGPYGPYRQVSQRFVPCGLLNLTERSLRGCPSTKNTSRNSWTMIMPTAASAPLSSWKLRSVNSTRPASRLFTPGHAVQ